MNWWVVLVFLGAGLVGVVIALSLTAGRPRSGPAPEVAGAHGGSRKSRYREDNDLVWNPAAFVAVACVVIALVVAAVLIEAL
jgi:hypothetical protein